MRRRDRLVVVRPADARHGGSEDHGSRTAVARHRGRGDEGGRREAGRQRIGDAHRGHAVARVGQHNRVGDGVAAVHRRGRDRLAQKNGIGRLHVAREQPIVADGIVLRNDAVAVDQGRAVGQRVVDPPGHGDLRRRVGRQLAVKRPRHLLTRGWLHGAAGRRDEIRALIGDFIGQHVGDLDAEGRLTAIGHGERVENLIAGRRVGG